MGNKLTLKELETRIGRLEVFVETLFGATDQDLGWIIKRKKEIKEVKDSLDLNKTLLRLSIKEIKEEMKKELI